MKIRTATWGEVGVSHDSFLTLPEGLIGFEDQQEYVILDREDCLPFRWLVSFQDPGLAFPLIDPKHVLSGYEVPLTAIEQTMLGLGAGESPLVYCLATVTDEGRQAYANLRAPLVINSRSRMARQVVLLNSHYEIQHPVLEPVGLPAAR